MKFFEFIRKALSENDGSPSSIRLNNFYLIVLLGGAMTFGFIWVILYYVDLISLYLITVVGFISGILGIKVYQKNIEVNSDNKAKDQATEIKLAEIKKDS